MCCGDISEQQDSARGVTSPARKSSYRRVPGCNSYKRKEFCQSKIFLKSFATGQSDASAVVAPLWNVSAAPAQLSLILELQWRPVWKRRMKTVLGNQSQVIPESACSYCRVSYRLSCRRHRQRAWPVPTAATFPATVSLVMNLLCKLDLKERATTNRIKRKTAKTRRGGCCGVASLGVSCYS